jgi:exosortase N
MITKAIGLPAIKPFNISLGTLLLLSYSSIAAWLAYRYITFDFNVCLGLATAPYICTVNKNKLSLQYLVPAIIVAVLGILLPVNSMLFIALLFAVLLLIENSIGKINHVVLFLLLLISPMFKYSLGLIELPVRFWLSGRVAALLNLIGIQASALGNQIVLNKYEFSVDPACAGLNMLAASLIIGLFVVAFYQRRAQTQLHFLPLAALLLATAGLNIVCNFFRITLLVLFKIMPGTFFHDFVGMFCLVLYVIVPLMYGCKLLFNHLAKSKSIVIPVPLPERKALRYPLLHLSLLAGILFMAIHLSAMQNSINTANRAIDLTGYCKTKLGDGVLKFENKDALIYLKPTAFYAPGHDPRICWTGSGYEFTNISRSVIAGTLVYTATLKKGTDKIYAAWWFDNGTIKTSDQLNWRWAVARGAAPFYLVNINTATPQLLQAMAANFLSRNNYLIVDN